jgi:glutamine synthetase
MTKKNITLKTELRRLLRRYPDTESMELLIPDLTGVLKGKRIRAKDFEKACTEPFWFCGGTVLLTALGEVVPGLPGSGDGDPDVPCSVVPGSLAPVPWSSRPMAQGLFRMFSADGAPFKADPRAVVERATAPLRKMGISIVMATELEFYLLDAKANRPKPRAPRVPGIGRPQPGVQVYHPDDLNEVQPFLDDVYDYCEAQNIPADTVISEYAPGQFEINLLHVDDPVSEPSRRRHISTASSPASWRNRSPRSPATACTFT